jgi:hypothetical protein
VLTTQFFNRLDQVKMATSGPGAETAVAMAVEAAVASPVPLVRSVLGVPQYGSETLLNELLMGASDSGTHGSVHCVSLVEAADLFGKDFGTEIALNQLHRKQSRVPMCVSTRGGGVVDSCVFVTANTITINAVGGRRTLTAKEYCARVLGVDRPQYLIVPADEVPLSSSWSRISKAHQKSAAWLTAVTDYLQTHAVNHSSNNTNNNCSSAVPTSTATRPRVFAVALPSRPTRQPKRGADQVDGADKFADDEDHIDIVIESLVESAKLLARNSVVDGIVIGGLGMGESIATLRKALTSVRRAVDESSVDNTNGSSHQRAPSVLVQGMHSLEQVPNFDLLCSCVTLLYLCQLMQVIECLCCGADMVATNLPELCTTSRIAMVTRLTAHINSSTTVGHDDATRLCKKRKADALEVQPESQVPGREASESNHNNETRDHKVATIINNLCEVIRIDDKSNERITTPLVGLI